MFTVIIVPDPDQALGSSKCDPRIDIKATMNQIIINLHSLFSRLTTCCNLDRLLDCSDMTN
jgi:hypothetical protein